MPSFREASQVASSATSFTCGIPLGVVAGDMLVAFHVADAGTLSNMATPTGGAGWNFLTERAAGSGGGTRVWWKFAGGSEPSSYGFTQNSAAVAAVSIIGVQGASGSTLVVAQSDIVGVTSIASTPSTIPNSSSDFEIRCATFVGANLARTWLPPSGFVERTDLIKMTTATRALSGSGATGTQDFTLSSSANGYIQGFTINIGVAPISVSSGWGMPI